MTFSKLKTMKKDRGFTIVELLIVIVIIAILAAIVIVAYNGITNRAKTSKALSAAQAVQQKASAYNAEIGYFPDDADDLLLAASDKSYAVTGITIDETAMSTVPATENEVSMVTCPAGSVTSAVTGVSIKYWDYAKSTPGPVTITAGSGC